jgi:hypothetical protein
MKQLIVLPLAAILAAPLFADGKVETDFDPDVNFTQFKRFSFIGGQELSKTGLLANPQTAERLMNFISGALQLRGLKEVPVDRKHDLDVRYWVARQKKTEETVNMVPSDPMFMGYPPFWTGPWGWYYEEYVVRNYVEGTLIVDLIDVKTKQLVWRTYLRQAIEDRQKAYDEAKKNLQKSFDMLPPTVKEVEKMRSEREKLAKKYGT